MLCWQLRWQSTAVLAMYCAGNELAVYVLLPMYCYLSCIAYSIGRLFHRSLIPSVAYSIGRLFHRSLISWVAFHRLHFIGRMSSCGIQRHPYPSRSRGQEDSYLVLDILDARDAPTTTTRGASCPEAGICPDVTGIASGYT